MLRTLQRLALHAERWRAERDAHNPAPNADRRQEGDR
jgi:hypothetical protein